MHISCDNKVLLIVDNHETHISLNAINYCRDNGIVMLSFPPHCTHRMQPLDIGVYGPFKNRCKSSFNDYILGHPGKAINIYNVAQLTAQPYLLSFTPLNITKAFTKSGFWPINSLACNDSHFTGVLQYEVDTHEPTSSQSPEETNIATTSLHLNAYVDSSKINIISNLVVVPSKDKDINVKEFIAGLLSLLLDNVLDKVTNASTNLNKKNLLSPTDIRPYTKLTVKPNKKSCKQGRSRIYTNTPGKNEIELATERRMSKKVKVVKRKIGSDDQEEKGEKGKLAKTKKMNVKTTDEVSNKASSGKGKKRMTSLAKPKRAKKEITTSSSDSEASSK
ncbi:hypothetical protein NQ314_013232 [Rhamnusium bicolor]|uniref:DDE-1 domain-containing protein n=1 Tax=Rhamnusium bicolor TaxID=1586634 RepID=A0AAV8X7Q2_9CUCU|nr:hypothetical protein NQ314_013232 [Rhamnusium bicolor]